MSLCWYIEERLPRKDTKDEFYSLFEERSALAAKSWDMSNDERKRVHELDRRLKELSVEAPIPPRWKRKGADSWMGADLRHCEYVLGFNSALSSELPYHDHSPAHAKEYAEDLREAMRTFKRNNPGWSRQRGRYSPRFELNIIESAVRYLERWSKRGYCIIASY